MNLELLFFVAFAAFAVGWFVRMVVEQSLRRSACHEKLAQLKFDVRVRAIVREELATSSRSRVK